MENSPVYELPDDPALLRKMNAAAGFLELGLPQDALNEICSIARRHSGLASVLNLRVLALMALQRFAEAAEISSSGRRKFPHVGEFYLHEGAALCALERTHDARDIWLAAPEQLRNQSVYHFNLAWCELEIGDAEKARRHLKNALHLDPAVAHFASADPRMSRLLSPEPTSPLHL